MKLSIIRHTAVAIGKGICYGQSDVPLATSFKDEKKAIQQKLKNKSFDVIYSSPLRRCRKLAEFLFPNTKIIFDDRLKELHFGEWENWNWDEIFESENGKKWFNDYFHQTCPKGESYDDLVKRVEYFYNGLTVSSDNNICIITHGGPMKIIKALAENRSVEKIFNSYTPAYGELLNIEIRRNE